MVLYAINNIINFRYPRPESWRYDLEAQKNICPPLIYYKIIYTLSYNIDIFKNCLWCIGIMKSFRWSCWRSRRQPLCLPMPWLDVGGLFRTFFNLYLPNVKPSPCTAVPNWNNVYGTASETFCLYFSKSVHIIVYFYLHIFWDGTEWKKSSSVARAWPRIPVTRPGLCRVCLQIKLLRNGGGRWQTCKYAQWARRPRGCRKRVKLPYN